LATFVFGRGSKGIQKGNDILKLSTFPQTRKRLGGRQGEYTMRIIRKDKRAITKREK